MTQNEFIERMDALEHQKTELRREYIESNQPIVPGQIVEVDGKRVWLEGYRLIGYHLHPKLRKLGKKGEPTGVHYTAKDYRTMKRCQ